MLRENRASSVVFGRLHAPYRLRSNSVTMLFVPTYQMPILGARYMVYFFPSQGPLLLLISVLLAVMRAGEPYIHNYTHFLDFWPERESTFRVLFCPEEVRYMYQGIEGGVAERGGFRMNRMWVSVPWVGEEGSLNTSVTILADGGEIKKVAYSTSENPPEGVIPVSEDDLVVNFGKAMALDGLEKQLETARSTGNPAVIEMYENWVTEYHAGLPRELQHNHDVSPASPVAGGHQVISGG